MSTSDTDTVQTHFDTLIIGTGFSGQCVAIKLLEAGKTDFVMLERAGDIGGTWRDNTYPGCACDIPSHLYSFSFEQNPDWSRKFPSQPEIYAYLKRVVEKYGLTPYIRFNHDVARAVYDPEARRWRVETNAGNFTARVLISAAGPLAEPHFPDIAGAERFQGENFHSARWNHDYDLSGKRVAVIGTGASAIQLVPSIAPVVKNLDVYQRTPPWVMPRPDRKMFDFEKRVLLRTPLKWLYRWRIYLANEWVALMMVFFPGVGRALAGLAKREIRKQVADPELLKKVIPNYAIGCKRVLVSNDWYPALARDNVDLITTGIKEITETGIVDREGTHREVDAIVYSTGFYATESPVAQKVVGADGRSLAEVWCDGEEAYLGALVHGFPNLFLVVGPNTGLGHNSMVFMIESQVNMIMDCLREMDQRHAQTIDVKPEAQARYNAMMQKQLRRTVWATGGCKSWYQHRSGKITTLWPGFTFGFWWRTRKAHTEDLQLS